MTDIALDIQQELLNHPRNLGVVYDPGPHTYHRHYDNGKVERWYGVTSLIKKYAPFEAQKIKFGIVNSKKEKYAHLNSIEDVEAEWEQARNRGSIAHDALEEWGQTGHYPDIPYVRKAVEFLQKNKLVPIAFEFVVWCPKLKRATPIDLLCVNEWGELVVCDYKTSKTIKKSFYRYNGNVKRMEYPLTHLPNSNYYQYCLQIGLAAKWLKDYYDLSFPIATHGYILHIKEDDFIPHVTLPMITEIEKIYEWERC